MPWLSVRNVHQALPNALDLLLRIGERRESRNGPVLVAPGPVTTEYANPVERLVFWPDRDVNTAFLVYEALWMLAGRRDLAPLLRYVKDFGRYSDDGETLHGAYGWRWRRHFGREDQLVPIARRLKYDPTDRRCVLGIWDPRADLDSNSKDVPCNDVVAFQRNGAGALDMTVFCRSNDVLWGAYFANAFHFSLLQEYLAGAIGCPVGTYWQISVNWHGYLATIEPLRSLPDAAYGDRMLGLKPADPYRDGAVQVTPFWDGIADSREMDHRINALLLHADRGTLKGFVASPPWFAAARAVLLAHELWRVGAPPFRFEEALAVLMQADQRNDLVQSMQQWVLRRYDRWLGKQKTLEQVS